MHVHVCTCVCWFIFTCFLQSGRIQGPSGSVPRAASHTTISAYSSQGFQGHFVSMGLKHGESGRGKGEKEKKKKR